MKHLLDFSLNESVSEAEGGSGEFVEDRRIDLVGIIGAESVL